MSEKSSQQPNGNRSVSLHGESPATFVKNEVRRPRRVTLCTGRTHLTLHVSRTPCSGKQRSIFGDFIRRVFFGLRLLGDSTPRLRRFPSVAACVQIRTDKYINWFLFLPQNIFEQFARAANLFYLLLSIISAIPGVRHAAHQP
jgi:hypothetical protein